VGVRAGLDRCGKSRPHRNSIPGPSSPWAVAIPTALVGRHILFINVSIIAVYVAKDVLKFVVRQSGLC
jgi:hypothetical protein